MAGFDLKAFLDDLVRKTIPELPEQFGREKMLAKQGEWLVKIAFATPGDDVAKVVTEAITETSKFRDEIKPVVDFILNREAEKADLTYDQLKEYQALATAVSSAYFINMQFGDMLASVSRAIIKAAGADDGNNPTD
jgi:hypothetical protein